MIGGNGAGKSSAIKMMVGDIKMSTGNVYMKGYSAKYDLNEIYKFISYCPQSGGLLPELTGGETLKILRLIKGVSKSEVKKNFPLKELGLSKLLKKRVKNLNDGNKRKLSTLLALIGDSKLIFLDEPTAGVDPKGRRILWDQIRKARDAGRTIILSTHSMDECEALCNRVGVMSEGELKCIGPIQHLKSKFANGYVLTIQIERDDAESVEKIICKVDNIFGPSAVFKEKISTSLIFNINDPKLSEVFGNMARLKENLKIENYTLNQMTLENVITKFHSLTLESIQ
jgi:ATP-binding cassette subfamily A (ABC1) protein 3